MKKIKDCNLWAAAVGEQRIDKTQKLIVPMHLEALVIGETDRNASLKWKSVTPNYDALNDEDKAPLGEYMVPPPCSNTASPIHGMGIHLHWVLPQAYRSGKQEFNDETPQFPFAPNRWLVTRIAESNGSSIIRRWIIESDYLHADFDEANWLLVEQNDSSKPLSTGDRFKTAMIGKRFDYDEWLNTGNKNAAGDVFLTIMSPCDPAFAASYNSCKNVFGFYDEHENDDPKATYTYSVTGWISNPEHDLLSNITDADAWVDKMQSLSWSITNAESIETLPGGVLCHAMINNVIWEPHTYTQSGKPTNNIKIGIGNTVSEALATVILEHKDSQFDSATNPYLAALQYNIMADHAIANGRDILKKSDALNSPGTNTRVLKKQAHNRGFHSVSGGKIWVINKKRNESSGLLSNEEKPEHNEPLQAAASNLLMELNKLQQEHDTALTITHALQAERYGNWYQESKLKAQNLLRNQHKTHHSAHDLLLNNIKKDNERIEGLLSSIVGYNAQEDKTSIVNNHYNPKIDTTKDLLIAALKADKNYEDYEITESTMPPFYTANEPSLVLSGLEPSASYTGSQQTMCRTFEQLVNAIAYNQDNTDLPAVKISYTEMVYQMALSTTYLPAEIPFLLAETLALSPLLATRSSELAWNYKGSPSQILKTAKDLTEIMSQPTGHAEKFLNSDHLAVLPLEYAIKQRQKQPWIPLFMEWEVEWQAGYTVLQNGEVLEKWEFGEGQGKQKLNNIDYALKAGAIKAGNADATYSGRVALSADLGDRLKEVTSLFGKSHVLANVQLMYQSLSSLNQQLLSLESAIQLPPVNRSGNAYPVDEVINHVGEHYLWNPSDKNPGFYPLRSGMFKIKNLHIVDAFGQSMPVISEDPEEKHHNSVHVSSNMEKVDSEFIALPPRLNNPARLRFKWLSAIDPARETDTDPGTSPICGWLLQNKLDNSLMVFNSDGNACCSLRLNSKGVLIWTAPPGKDLVGGLAGMISNARLLDFVNSVLDAGQETFAELLMQTGEMAKKALRSGLSINNTANLPLGTPMAIASASCHLELKDPPARNWNSNAAEQSNLSNVSFPFYIGNNLSKKDGLICYYADVAANGAERILRLPFAQYIANKSANMVANQPVHLSVAGTMFKSAPATQLLLILHPFMNVTISSGILPDANFTLAQFNMAKVLEKINFNFMINPVLVPGNQMNVPIADVAGKKWFWLEKRNDTLNNSASIASWNKAILDNKKSGKLTFSPVTAREGWLQIEKAD